MMTPDLAVCLCSFTLETCVWWRVGHHQIFRRTILTTYTRTIRLWTELNARTMGKLEWWVETFGEADSWASGPKRNTLLYWHLDTAKRGQSVCNRRLYNQLDLGSHAVPRRTSLFWNLRQVNRLCNDQTSRLKNKFWSRFTKKHWIKLNWIELYLPFTRKWEDTVEKAAY